MAEFSIFAGGTGGVDRKNPRTHYSTRDRSVFQRERSEFGAQPVAVGNVQRHPCLKLAQQRHRGRGVNALAIERGDDLAIAWAITIGSSEGPKTHPRASHITHPVLRLDQRAHRWQWRSRKSMTRSNVESAFGSNRDCRARVKKSEGAASAAPA